MYIPICMRNYIYEANASHSCPRSNSSSEKKVLRIDQSKRHNYRRLVVLRNLVKLKFAHLIMIILTCPFMNICVVNK